MLGIIILNYNGFAKTIECINSIITSVHTSYRIYLVDNASHDDSVSILREAYKDSENIKIIESKENLGYARGNNLGIEYAETDGCEYLLISNNDIIYKYNAIDTLYKDITEHREYLLVGPMVCSLDGYIQKSYKCSRPSYHEYIVNETYLRKFRTKKKTREYLYIPDTFTEVYWISGCCFIINRIKFKNLNYFDPFTFLYFEEYIISEKAIDNKYKIGYEPNAKVLHHHGATVKKGIPGGAAFNYKVRAENLRSEIYFINKYWNYNRLKSHIICMIRKLEIVFTFRSQSNKREVKKYYKRMYHTYIREIKKLKT